MSYKQNLIKLLQQKETPTPSVSNTSINVNKVDNKRKKQKQHTDNKILKGQWKVSNVRRVSDDYSNGYVETENSSSLSTSDSEECCNSKTKCLITEDKWKNERNTADITPSKSEYGRKPLQEDTYVDTIYDNENSIDDHIFSISSDSNNEDFEETKNIIIPDAYTEIDNITPADSSPIIYNMQNGKVVILKNKNNFYVHGSFKLFLLHGSIHLLGYKLKSFHTEVEIHSLRGFSYLCIQNIHKEDNRCLDLVLKEELCQRGVDESDITKILSEIEPCDTILVCSQLNNFKILYIEKHVSQKLLPAVEDFFPIVFKNDFTDRNIFKYNEEWNDIADTVDKSSKLMICGGKGVGKSTVLRYMINRLLMKFSSVLVIDLDPGQSEFTIPGCVSAVIVKQPVFGPNFTHLQTPERCVFVENIDVTLAPDLYIESVKELIKQSENLPEIPTLINYMGYSQSVGIDIASSIISYVSPTILLQINSTQYSRNFPENLTSEAVKNHLEMFAGANPTNLSYKFFAVDSMADGLTSWQAQGRIIREMCVLSYFSEVLDSSLSLTSRCVPLFKILLKNITLMDCNLKTVKHKGAVFNASLVTLCTTTARKNIYNCHGWGIVRCIDHEHLVLITPVCEDILKKVTHLAIGSVTLPPSMLMYEDENVGLIPYISLGCIATFNNIPKRSYLPKKQT